MITYLDCLAIKRRIEKAQEVHAPIAHLQWQRAQLMAELFAKKPDERGAKKEQQQ